jgi:hypothetical protein
MRKLRHALWFDPLLATVVKERMQPCEQDPLINVCPIDYGKLRKV